MKAFIFFLLCANVWSLDCTIPEGFNEIDMRSEMGPIRDQDSVGWCYGFSSADMTTHWLHQNKELLGLSHIDFTQKENMVSAAGLTLTFNTHDRRRFNRSDALLQRLELEELSIQRDRHQLELDTIAEEIYSDHAPLKNAQEELIHIRERIAEGIKSSIFSLRMKQLTALLETRGTPLLEVNEAYQKKQRELNNLNQILTEVGQASIEPDGGKAFEVLEDTLFRGLVFEKDLRSDDYEFSNLEKLIEALYDISIGKEPCDIVGVCNPSEVINQIFAGTNFEQIEAILTELSVDPIADLLNITPNRFFFPPGMMPTPVKPERLKRGSPEIFNWVDQQLHNGNIVEIGYNSNCIKNRHDDSEPSWHSSTLVGKKFNCELGEVEYILRNSWGPNSCATTYERKLRGVEDVSEMPFRCEDGHYLVRKSILSSHVREVSALN